MLKPKLAIFASGAGSNVDNLIRYAQKNPVFEPAVVVSNKTDAPVLQLAKSHGVPTLLIEKTDLLHPEKLIKTLASLKIDGVVLAGFLKKIPTELIQAYPNRIINIHPALLPHYGGKGMYGMNVHEAVIQNKEAFSGITIHLVNEHYDEGQILFQEKISIEADETPESLAKRIHSLEHKFYPTVLTDYWHSLTSR
jgi:phosphoribosylglycinamide formyltransferase-1